MPFRARQGTSRKFIPSQLLPDFLCFTLPAIRRDPQPRPWYRKEPEQVNVDQSPIETDIRKLGPIVIHQVRRTSFEQLYNGFIAQFHYLGYVQPVGEHLK
ncbi:MAG: DUF4338 domain-containing protein [Candidatus Tectomicrobia bacterium]|uniref:DUF4338 domain-containing protein n=1 Tax=Tectimicrobiota bacterium TaxID=2528274 RepID=A0A933LPP7_UNCTE|nr:DUF4338 domain-containing protein [Candidatus Tectomicrobia bacterium]